MFEIIKIKMVEKKVAHHGWATRNFFKTKILSLSGLVCKRYVLSHAFHDFFKRSNNEGDFP